jgi:hydrogenase expression/formation protein HypC
MCLAIPGKVIEIIDEGGLKMGKVDYAGIVKTVCLEYIPEIKIGEYTVVHAGFGLSIIDEEEAAKSYEAWEELLSIGPDQSRKSNEDNLQVIRAMKQSTSEAGSEN